MSVRLYAVFWTAVVAYKRCQFETLCLSCNKIQIARPRLNTSRISIYSVQDLVISRLR